MNMQDKVAVVTGAASGIGKEIAKTYFDHGAKVAIADLNLDAAQAVAREFDPTGERAVAVAMEGAPRIRRGSRAVSSMRRKGSGIAPKPSASTSRRPGRQFARRQAIRRTAARLGKSTRRIPYPAKPSPYRVAYVLLYPFLINGSP